MTLNKYVLQTGAQPGKLMRFSKDGQCFYTVLWKGYDEPTREPIANL